MGQLGPRGRRNYSWNETQVGSGGRFVDWWLFGGCVYIRAILFVWDKLFTTSDNGEDGASCDEGGGENVFACFGVTTQDNGKDDNTGEKRPVRQHAKHVGIIGYDSSLGAHGPIVLAYIRASVFVLAWCSICTFSMKTHEELTNWLVNFDGEAFVLMPAVINEQLVTLAFCLLRGIQYVMNFNPSVFWDDNKFSNSTTSAMFVGTILYTKAFVILLECALFVLGVLLNVTGIYIPKGVSHPGGPRPHRIMRVPKWTSGIGHVIPKELLETKEGKWRCAVAHDAHRDTLAQFKTVQTKNDDESEDKPCPTLTGEPFGRQLWTVHKRKPRLDTIETEDDLNTILKIEVSSNANTSKEGNGNNNQHKEEEKNLFQHIGDLFSPRKDQERSNNSRESNDLVEKLASGGRTPLAFDPSKNVNSCDQIFRAQMISSYIQDNGGKLPEDIAHMQTKENSQKARTVEEAAKRGVAFYSMLQTSDGHWAGDYGGPHFLMPGLIVAWYIMGKPAYMISSGQQSLMLHYLKVHQQEDGGWGTHIESPSTMFGTVICYLAVRLLGAKKDDDWVVKGREFILREGGAVMTSSWAKFWLCLIGCMDWKGMYIMSRLFLFDLVSIRIFLIDFLAVTRS